MTGAHPVPQVRSEDRACCSRVQSRCFRLSLAALVFSRRKLAKPMLLDFNATPTDHSERNRMWGDIQNAYSLAAVGRWVYWTWHHYACTHLMGLHLSALDSQHYVPCQHRFRLRHHYILQPS